MKFVFLFALSLLILTPVTAEAANIRAAAAIVIDFDHGEIIFEQDIHTARPPASMTKIMTAFIVYEEIAAGNLTMDTMVTISQNAARVSGGREYQGMRFPLQAGSSHSIDTLLHLIMLPSSNGACVALAEHISGSEEAFVDLMNETAASLGLWSDFRNSHGAVLHHTNAYSVGWLVYTFIQRHPDILRITSTANMTFNNNSVNNTNLLLRTRPFAGADGFKTGTTIEAGWNLASTAVRDGRRIIVVTMNSPSNEWRYNDAHALLEFGFIEAARRDTIRRQTEEERAEAERLEAEWQEQLRREIEASRISVTVNGNPVLFDQFPRIIYGLAFAPYKPLLDAMGVKYHQEENGNILIGTNNGSQVLLLAGQDLIYAENRFIPSFSPQLVGDEIFVPLRYVADVLGFENSWEGETRTVHLTLPGGEYVYYIPQVFADEELTLLGAIGSRIPFLTGRSFGIRNLWLVSGGIIGIAGIVFAYGFVMLMKLRRSEKRDERLIKWNALTVEPVLETVFEAAADDAAQGAGLLSTAETEPHGVFTDELGINVDVSETAEIIIEFSETGEMYIPGLRKSKTPKSKRRNWYNPNKYNSNKHNSNRRNHRSGAGLTPA